ncbi:MAG: hypothetical protein HUU21_35030, partial [Polyangiaceae bacterium]|nr:hypothetical protein [Polyangiaceae bacterium]
MGGVILMVAGTGGSVGGGVISASGIGAAIGVPAAVASPGLVTVGAGNFASGLAGLGKALSTGSGSGAGSGAAAKLTGQKHHPISKEVHRALEEHQNLKGHYKYRDPRFVTQGKDLGAHHGYERWHIDLDTEIAAWIRGNKTATPESFEKFLRDRYAKPDLKSRFPNGF